MAKLKLTPKLGQQIVDMIKRGNHAKVAARACGITEVTFYDWLKQGEKSPKGIFHDFYEAIQQANAAPEVNVVGALYTKAVEGDVRAMDIFLARRYRDRWGTQQTLNIGNADDKPFQAVQQTFDLSKMNDAQLVAYQAYLETFADDSQSTNQANDEPA